MIKCCHKCWNIYYVASENPWHPQRCGCQTRYDTIHGYPTIPSRTYYNRISMEWDPQSREPQRQDEFSTFRNLVRERLHAQQQLERQRARAAAMTGISRAEYQQWLRESAATFNSND